MNTNEPAASCVDTELISRLVSSYGIDPAQAERIIESILVSFGSTVEEWIRSRHIALQRQGLKNDKIYQIIAEELPFRRFTAVALSERQIRRMIYG
ncbi:MAG: hypothetical protein WCT14_17565 [Treponemataceae bacterium]